MNAFLQCFFPTDSDRDRLTDGCVNDASESAPKRKFSNHRCHSVLVLPHLEEDRPESPDVALLRQGKETRAQATAASNRRIARSYSERLPSRCHEPELPEFIGASESKILCNIKHQNTLLAPLQASLPHRYRGYNWDLLYTSSHHGASLGTFLHKVKNDSPTLILLETVCGDVLGGFVTTPWQSSSSYYGNGECYVFSCTPEFRKYSWTRRNSYFMLSNHQCIAMGGGGRFAWYLDAELSKGSSGQSYTFMNPCLARNPEFELYSIEVWGFLPKFQ